MFDELMGLPVPMRAGAVFIDVWNCRATVVRLYALADGALGKEYPSNAEELEEDAADALREQGGAINISGMYRCPSELAARAQWVRSAAEEGAK